MFSIFPIFQTNSFIEKENEWRRRAIHFSAFFINSTHLRRGFRHKNSRTAGN